MRRSAVFTQACPTQASLDLRRSPESTKLVALAALALLLVGVTAAGPGEAAPKNGKEKKGQGADLTELFDSRPVAGPFDKPITFDYLPNGKMIVGEKSGQIYLVDGSGIPKLLLDLSAPDRQRARAGTGGRRGRLRLRLHPADLPRLHLQGEPAERGRAPGAPAQLHHPERRRHARESALAGDGAARQGRDRSLPAGLQQAGLPAIDLGGPPGRHRALRSRRDDLRRLRRLQPPGLAQQRGLPHLQPGEHRGEDPPRRRERQRPPQPSLLPEDEEARPDLHQDLRGRLPEPVPLRAHSERQAPRLRRRLEPPRGDQRRQQGRATTAGPAWRGRSGPRSTARRSAATASTRTPSGSTGRPSSTRTTTSSAERR